MHFFAFLLLFFAFEKKKKKKKKKKKLPKRKCLFIVRNKYSARTYRSEWELHALPPPPFYYALLILRRYIIYGIYYG